MSLPKSPLTYSPFSNLNKKIEPRVDRLTPEDQASIERAHKEDAGTVFLAAMSDVEPLSAVNKIAKRNPPSPNVTADDPDSEQVRKLIDLVLKGEGYSVADTPEYMEGTGYNVHPGDSTAPASG